MDWLSPAKEASVLVFPFLDSVPAIRAMLGFVIVFLLPGFAWTLVFFRNRQINIIERLAISFGLSIAVVTLSMLALNKLIGVRITGLNSVLAIVAITIVPVAFYFFKRVKGRRGSVGTE